jgi:hypothetical protein
MRAACARQAKRAPQPGIVVKPYSAGHGSKIELTVGQTVTVLDAVSDGALLAGEQLAWGVD